ncbi:thioesterase family protein [Chitinibacter sp. ZOR0017]|uniref:acyl-CoA thioesterase n=1 Tax=Chitinibacter sp. ZOR0017 TaxID=1339254 RepID=UPI000647E1B9|nr:acyl-CoA thioesterase [Chitinibacter sp. ZOR0017]
MATPTLIKVRGYHLDLYGHVNNARYLEFLEEARWALLEEYGGVQWYAERELALVVSRIDIRYKRPATMGDELLIHTRLATLGEKDGVIEQRIVRQDNGKLVAEAEVTFAVLHPREQGAQSLVGELGERLRRLQYAVEGA